MSTGNGDNEEDPWWIPIYPAKRPRVSRMRIASSDEEEDEKEEGLVEGAGGGSGDDNQGKYNGSDGGSATTEVVAERLSDAGNHGLEEVEEQRGKDEEDDDEDELLSIGSCDDAGSPQKKEAKDEDFDSDETCFEPPPSRVSSPRPRNRNGKRRLSSSFNPDSDDETAVSSDVIAGPSSPPSDPSYEPIVDYPDSSDLSEDEDFKKPSKKAGPSTSRYNSAGAGSSKNAGPKFDDSSEDDDAVIPLPRRDRPEFQPMEDFEQFWNQMDQDTSTPPTYNPNSVSNENWHGDVQRTITMFNSTLEGMPMPGDDGIEDIKLPPGLVELYSHQTYALRWMSWREGQFPGGGILADEMGLGKTIEVIALIMKSKWDAAKSGNENNVTSAEAKKCIPSNTTLVVCPLGCVRQWEREIGTKGRDLTVYKYHGPKKTSSAVELSKYDIVITTYQTIANEIPKITDPPKRCYSPLKRLYWLRIVLDEAHQIRNPKTNAAQAIFQLEARHRWAVTGTPIHNKPEDFYSMCTFLRLTPFDDRGVWDVFIGLKTVKRGAENRLHILGKALILRRTKEEVGLTGDGKVDIIPPKNVEVVTVELSAAERSVYDMLMDYAQSILKKFLSQKEQREHGLQLGGLIFAGNRLQERREECPDDIRFSHIFALLIRLRQCAVLPHLIETMLHEEELDGEKFDDLKPEHIVSKRNPVFDRLFVSSKFQKILDDIDELRAKADSTGQPMDKVIIVSSWTSTLDVIYEHLLGKNYTCVFITGRDDMNIRMDNMDRFNKNKWRPQILLLSLMAGGVGLNLVGANHVFFIEPHWNPQHELQAQDRVHRFGQTKDVFIRRYVTENTIESRIMELQQQKRELADGLLSNTKKKRGAGITLEQMKHLFDLSSLHNAHQHPPAQK